MRLIQDDSDRADLAVSGPMAAHGGLEQWRNQGPVAFVTNEKDRGP